MKRVPASALQTEEHCRLRVGLLVTTRALLHRMNKNQGSGDKVAEGSQPPEVIIRSSCAQVRTWAADLLLGRDERYGCCHRFSETGYDAKAFSTP
jgi:hypothetical protein